MEDQVESSVRSIRDHPRLLAAEVGIREGNHFPLAAGVSLANAKREDH